MISAPNMKIRMGIINSPPATPSKLLMAPDHKARRDAGIGSCGSVRQFVPVSAGVDLSLGLSVLLRLVANLGHAWMVTL